MPRLSDDAVPFATQFLILLLVCLFIVWTLDTGQLLPDAMDCAAQGKPVDCWKSSPANSY